MSLERANSESPKIGDEQHYRMANAMLKTPESSDTESETGTGSDHPPTKLVIDLKSRYRLLVLSNTNAIHIDMVREHYGILRHFDHLVLSHEVKAMKPDPRIYAAALAHANAEPHECFFTDDIADYVEGARRGGRLWVTLIPPMETR